MLPRHLQFSSQVVQQRVADAHVGLGIFEVDGVHLVGHDGRPHLGADDLLAEIAEGNVRPHVPVEIEQNRIEAHQPVKDLRHVIVGLDLNGERIEGESETVFYEVPRDGFPGQIGIDDEVRVVVAHRSVEFTEVFAAGNLVILALPAGDEYGQFLSDGCRRGGLSMGTAQHRDGCRFDRKSGRGRDHLLPFGQPFLLNPVLEHEGVGEIIDVFGGTTEMDRLGDDFQGGSGDGFP